MRYRFQPLVVAVALLLTAVRQAAPQQPVVPAETPAEHNARMAWWRVARFGMFIHWGVYAVPAGVYGSHTNYAEWYFYESKMPMSEYEKFALQFNPVKFNATEFVRIAKSAGMKYIVITSKHHDGFNMFPSRYTNWCISRTPFKRDPLMELSKACQKAGIKFCVYHSIMDWHSRYWPERMANNDTATGAPDIEKYVAYLKNDLKQLVTSYHPGIIWFDGQWPSSWTAERGRDLYAYVRGLDSRVIINNRVGKSADAGDYGTPEQTIPAQGFGAGVDWESCMTMNDHWGYNSHDKNFKSALTIVSNLVDCASKGGNYLLNVGPTSEGLIPPESVERLAQVGAWMKANSACVTGTAANPFKATPWGRCTQKEGRLYLELISPPADGSLLIPMRNTVRRAVVLGDPLRAVPFQTMADGLHLTVPASLNSGMPWVVELDLNGKVQPL